MSPMPTFSCFAMSSGSATSLESFGWSPSVIFTGSMFFCAAVEMISPLMALSPLETLTPVSTEARTPSTPSMPAIWSRWKSPTVLEYASLSSSSLRSELLTVTA